MAKKDDELNIREAEEISPEDLEAAGDFYDRLDPDEDPEGDTDEPDNFEEDSIENS